MTKVTPSLVVAAIDQMFGPQRSEFNRDVVQFAHRAEVETLVSLLDDIPRELIALPVEDYVRLNRCRASLAGALALWSANGRGPPAAQVEMSDPVALVRRLLASCPDELPPPVDLEFVDDLGARAWILERTVAAWTDFTAAEWLGTTVMAGAALEGLLLWALKSGQADDFPAAKLDKFHLGDLIERAERLGVLDAQAAAQARQASDARNLVHPGKVERQGRPATRGTALSALAALDNVVDALTRKLI